MKNKVFNITNRASNKAKQVFFALLFGGMFMTVAQTPGIPYQAYIIDTNSGYIPGEQIEVPLANASILLRFEIRDDKGDVEYVEEISARTDEFGMVSTVIGVGNGTPIMDTFDDINWNGKQKLLFTDIDMTGTGADFVDHDSMEIVYIPGPGGGGGVETITTLAYNGDGSYTYTNEDGATTTFSVPQHDSGNPNALGTAGNAGNLYVDESTGDLYIHDGSSWVSLTLGGLLTGTGEPTDTDPANPAGGDIYVDESTGEIYTYNSTTNMWEKQSVVSEDDDNIIVEGSDGLAYLSAAELGIYTGVDAPTASNPTDTPEAGDVYVDETTGDIYTYINTEWIRQSGAKVAVGTGEPTDTDPANPAGGDIYVDESTGEIYTYNNTTNMWENQSDVVSTDADNIIVEGSDGLAYLSAAELGIYTGVDAPTASNPTDTPEAGDVYVDETTGDIYTYINTEWIRQAEVNNVTEAATVPTAPVEGDVWFDTTTNISKVYDADTTSWITIDPDSVTVDATAPTTPAEGDIWFDTTENLTKVWDGTSTWEPIKASTAYSLWDNDLDTGIQVEESADDDMIRFYTRDVQRMQVDSLGNVGIGGLPHFNTPQRRFLVVNDPLTGYAFSDINSTSSDPNNYVSLATAEIRNKNNALYFLVSGQANERKAGIQVGHDASAHSVNVGTLTLNPVGGNVGIGTLTPSVPLDVNGMARIRTLPSGADTNKVVTADENGFLRALALAEVGTDSQTLAFDNSTATDKETTITLDNSSQSLSLTASGNLRFNTTTSSDLELIVDGSKLTDTDGDTQIQVEESTDEDTIRFDTDGLERMTITASGTVGIGTTAPTALFQVQGNVITLDPTVVPYQIAADLTDTWTELLSDTTGLYLSPDAISFGNTAISTSLRPLEFGFETANTNESGFVVSNSTRVKDELLTSYWVYLLDGLIVKAVQFEFRLNGTALEARSVGAQFRSDLPGGVTTSLQNEAYFSGAGWSDGVYSLDLVRVNTQSITESNVNDVLTVQEEGRVGINTLNPTEALDVNGNTRIRTLPVGAVTDSIVTANVDGDLRKQSISDIAAAGEPWFTEGTTTGHTLNTGNMFFSGNLAVGTNTFSAGKVATFAGDVDVDGEARIRTLPVGAATDSIVTANVLGDLRKQSISDIAAAKEPWFGDDDDAGATENDEDIYHMGLVGLNVTDPTHRLDVHGAGLFRNGNGTGVFTGDQLRFSYDGSTNYSNAIRTRHNGSNDFGNAIDFYTFDSGVDAVADSPTLHGMTVSGGRVGVSERSPSTFLHVKNTNALDATAVNTVNPIFRMQREGEGGKYTQNAEFAIGTFESSTGARTRLDLRLGYGDTDNIDATPMTILANGMVGINANFTPEYNMDVKGTFRNFNEGMFVVMNGDDEDVADTTPGGSSKRGIYLWDSNHNYGIYASRAGAGRSMASGTATDGGNFMNHAVRFRTNANILNGFIFEDSDENLLASIRGNDGMTYFTGKVGIGTGATNPTKQLDVDGEARVRTLPVGAATDSIVTANVDGDLRKQSITDIVASVSATSFRTVTTNTTLTSTDGTVVVRAVATTAITITLPLASDLPQGGYLTIKRLDDTATPAAVNIVAGNATDTIDANTNAAYTTQLATNAAKMTLQSDGVSAWYIISE